MVAFQMSRTTANLLLLLAGLLWGGGFIAQQTAMESIGPFLFIALRFALAAIAILPLAIWEAKRAPEHATGWSGLMKKDLRGIAWVSIIFFIAMALQQVGLLATTVTNAGMLTGLYVVLVPVILFLFLSEKPPALIWPCAIAATFGIWLLGGGGFDRFTWGDIVVFVGAIFAALHVIAVGRVASRSKRPITIAVSQFALGAIIATIAFGGARMIDWQYEPAVTSATLYQALPEILYAAWIAGAAAFTLMAVCQQFTPAPDAAILLSSEALFAALGGAIVLGERLDLLGYIGCAILFSAIVLVSFASTKVEN